MGRKKQKPIDATKKTFRLSVNLPTKVALEIDALSDQHDIERAVICRDLIVQCTHPAGLTNPAASLANPTVVVQLPPDLHAQVVRLTGAALPGATAQVIIEALTRSLPRMIEERERAGDIPPPAGFQLKRRVWPYSMQRRASSDE